MRTVFKNCTLLDGTLDMQPKPGTDVAIENGIITEIGSIAPWPIFFKAENAAFQVFFNKRYYLGFHSAPH